MVERLARLPLVLIASYYVFTATSSLLPPLLGEPARTVYGVAAGVAAGLGYYHVAIALASLALFTSIMLGFQPPTGSLTVVLLASLASYIVGKWSRIVLAYSIAVPLASLILLSASRSLADLMLASARGLGVGGYIVAASFTDPLFKTLLLGSSAAILVFLGLWAAELSQLVRPRHPAVKPLAAKWLEAGRPEEELFSWSTGFTLGLLLGPITGFLVSALAPENLGSRLTPLILTLVSISIAAAWRFAATAYAKAPDRLRIVSVLAVALFTITVVAVFLGPGSAAALLAEAAGLSPPSTQLQRVEVLVGSLLEDSLRVFDHMLQAVVELLWG